MGPIDAQTTDELLRAAHALKAAQGLLEEDKAFRLRYRAYVDRFGPAILMNGLGQALATERAAAGISPSSPEERAHAKLYEAAQDWLCRPSGVYEGGADVLSAITSQDERSYLRAQSELLAWMEWHKKFCRAMLPRDDDTTSADGGL